MDIIGEGFDKFADAYNIVILLTLSIVSRDSSGQRLINPPLPPQKRNHVASVRSSITCILRRGDEDVI